MSATSAETMPVVPPKSGKLLKFALIGLLAVVVAGAGAGGVWLFMGGKGHDDAGEERRAAPERAPTPTYLALENMVVNLADPGGERVAQIGITLDLDSDKSVGQIKVLLPTIRSRVLLLISQRSSGELLKRDGKEKLADDIAAEVARALGHDDEEPPRRSAPTKKAADEEETAERPVRKKRRAPPSPVNGVLFSSFIVQ